MQVRSLVRELGSHMPPGQKSKTLNRSNTVTNSIETLKMVHIKKKKKKDLVDHAKDFGLPAKSRQEAWSVCI